MNEMNDETQESNDCKRQLRLQKRREQAEQDLPVMRQNQRERRQSRTAVRRARETSQKTHISGSKPNYSTETCQQTSV